MEHLKPGKDNKESRINFVTYWASYIQSHSDQDWGQQQNVVINSQLKSAHQWSRKEYLQLKRTKT